MSVATKAMQLRAKTGLPAMLCKQAVVESNGDDAIAERIATRLAHEADGKT